MFRSAGAEGHWEWAGGDGGWWEKDSLASTSYVNWYPGTPEPNGGVRENAALINYFDIHDGQDLRGGWVDAHEGWTVCGIIEIEGWQEESWSAKGTHEECHACFAGWSADVHAMIDHIATPFKWALF